MTLAATDITRFLNRGEDETLEFKRSTGEMKEAMRTLCAFLNGVGGTVLFGVRPDGSAEGQEVADKTLREIAQATERFEPAAHIAIRRAKVDAKREVPAISVDAGLDKRPFAYDGRPYERVGSATRRMPQSKYDTALLDRAHSARRWENEVAERMTLRDIDGDEVFRIVNIAASLGRLVGPVGSRVGEILDRLNLRRHEKILQAAVVLFGKNFMPDYPQCELRMARFRGTDKTEFMDQRQVRAPAFRLLEEAELFCRRHFPMPAKIVPERLRRVESPLIPIDAMREILVNAIIHRDYSISGGAISLAIFDDRVEVWSAGAFPAGITPENLSKSHFSVQRNPVIADVFNRAGLIEKWGRGTNRVIQMCRDAGLIAPAFEQITGAAVVTFRVDVLALGHAPTGAEAAEAIKSPTKSPTMSPTMPPTAPINVAGRIMALLRGGEMSAGELRSALGIRHTQTFRENHLSPALRENLIEYTIPAKPKSRLQKYRLTEKGRQTVVTGQVTGQVTG